MKGLMFALLLLAAPAGLPSPLPSPALAHPAGDIGVAMQRLQAKILALGAPSLKGEGSIHGKTVPVLYFGQTQVNDNFALLDDAGKEVGGAATIFVKSGDEFVRVVTNVTNSDGSRGIGTVLNRKGKLSLPFARAKVSLMSSTFAASAISRATSRFAMPTTR